MAVGAAFAVDFSAGDSTARMPRRLRRRLLETARAPLSAAGIEAKLNEATQRRQAKWQYLKQRESPHSRKKHGEHLSKKLARCWRRFAQSRKTTFALAKAYEALEINESSVESLSFEHLAVLIESATTLETVKVLLDRLESRLMLYVSSSSSSPENIDHLLKRVATPKRRTPPSKATRTRGVAKRGPPKETSSSETNKLSRYSARVVLCAYMILGQPKCVFSVQGQSELALAESAGIFVRELELMIKIILDSPNCSPSPMQSSPASAQLPCQPTFRTQLTTFDTAWRSYLYHFVVWKVKDARSLEDELVRTACQLELSMMQKCKLTVQGHRCDLTHDMRSIQTQVSEDQKILKEKVLHLGGDAGINRMERALSDTRTRFFEAKESGTSSVSLIAHIPTSASSSSSTQPLRPATENLSLENNGMPSQVVHSLSGSTSPVRKAGAETVSAKVLSSGAIDRQSPDNELLVNEFMHGGVSTLTNNQANQCQESSNMKVKVREAMEKAFWDDILESLKGDTTDFGRIVKLVQEVRDELCEMAPSSWKQEIFDSIDVDILSQVLESGTQDTNYFGGILEYALVKLQKLSAPANDNEMKKDCHKLLSELARIAQSDNKESSSLLLATVKGLRFVLEQIQTLKTEISKAHIQLMEPIINGSAGVEYLQKAFVDRYGLPSSSATSLPLTAQWISTLGTILEEEWNEHVNSRNNGLPQGTVLRTGGHVSLPSKQNVPVVSASGGNEQPECSGGKVDILVRLGLLKLASGIEGVTEDTVPETFKLNALRLRALQSQLQEIIVISTSVLILRQILVSEKPAPSPSELESSMSGSLRRLSELLGSGAEVGLEEIVGALVGHLSSETKLKSRREMVARMVSKSLQRDDAVFKMVSKSIYLAVGGVVLGGSGARGRELADAALRRVGGSALSERVVKLAEALVVMANVSASVHGQWYRSFLR